MVVTEVTAPATPFEYRPERAIPEELELCARCLQGVVFRRGPAPGVPYCPRCDAETPSIQYVRKPEAPAPVAVG